jgi:hypothetical protein
METWYERVTDYLRRKGADRIPMRFADFETMRGKPLPPAARKYVAWWSNTRPHARSWTDAGYEVRQVRVTEEAFTFVRRNEAVIGAPPGRRSRDGWPAAQLLTDLDREFEKSIAGCRERAIFTGPSVYFYERTVGMVRQAASLRDLAKNDLFYDYVYATLTAWGMHRMGERVPTKLTAFPIFQTAVRRFLEDVDDLRLTSICELSDQERAPITSRLAKLVDTPGISASGAPLVANSKTLHFLLPDLVPPIDRTYTCRLFYGRMQPPGRAGEVFTCVFSSLAVLAKTHEAVIREAVGSYICLGHAKALDNAIVGFVLNHPERFPDKSARRRDRREARS